MKSGGWFALPRQEKVRSQAASTCDESAPRHSANIFFANISNGFPCSPSKPLGWVVREIPLPPPIEETFTSSQIALGMDEAGVALIGGD
jgi:hypothetical protein